VQELFPEESYTYRALAWIYLKQGNTSDALEQLRIWERHESAPDDETLRIAELLRSSALSQSGKPEEARSSLEQYMGAGEDISASDSQYDTGA